jgi:hypothetical protein
MVDFISRGGTLLRDLDTTRVKVVVIERRKQSGREARKEGQTHSIQFSMHTTKAPEKIRRVAVGQTRGGGGTEVDGIGWRGGAKEIEEG